MVDKNPQGRSPAPEKKCYTFLVNISTTNHNIIRLQKAKLSQEEIDEIQEEIAYKYPTQGEWIKATTKEEGCNCK